MLRDSHGSIQKLRCIYCPFWVKINWWLVNFTEQDLLRRFLIVTGVKWGVGLPHTGLMSTRRWNQQQEFFLHTLKSAFLIACVSLWLDSSCLNCPNNLFQVRTKGFLMIKIPRGSESEHRRSKAFCRGFSSCFNFVSAKQTWVLARCTTAFVMTGIFF